MLLAFIPCLGQSPPVIRRVGMLNNVLLDLVYCLLICLLPLLGLLVDDPLVLDLLDINVLVARLILKLLAFLISAQEEPHAANDHFFVVTEAGFLHDVAGAGICPDLAAPEFTGNSCRPHSLG